MTWIWGRYSCCIKLFFSSMIIYSIRMISFNMYPDIECCVFLYMYHRNVSGLYDILICKLKSLKCVISNLRSLSSSYQLKTF